MPHAVLLELAYISKVVLLVYVLVRVRRNVHPGLKHLTADQEVTFLPLATGFTFFIGERRKLAHENM